MPTNDLTPRPDEPPIDDILVPSTSGAPYSRGVGDTPAVMEDGTPIADLPLLNPFREGTRHGNIITSPIDPAEHPEKFPDKPPLNPWDRQQNEPMRSYRAFEVYRGMDPEERSMRRMTEIVEARRSKRDGELKKFYPFRWERITKWSATYGWVKRAKAWDDEVMRLTANKHLRDTVQMHERHVNLALRMQSLAAQRMNEMKPAELGRRDIDRWLEKAIRLERQGRGLDRIGQAGNVQNLGVNVNVQTQPQPPASHEPDAETPIGEYLMTNPGDVTVAVDVINELLRAVANGAAPAAGVSGES